MNGSPKGDNYKDKNKEQYYINIGFIGEERIQFFNSMLQHFEIEYPKDDNFLIAKKDNMLLQVPNENYYNSYRNKIIDYFIEICSMIIYVTENKDLIEIKKINSKINEKENRIIFIIINHLKNISDDKNYLIEINKYSPDLHDFSFNDDILTYSMLNETFKSPYLFFQSLSEDTEKKVNNINKMNFDLISEMIKNSVFYRKYKKFNKNENKIEINFKKANKELKVEFSQMIEELNVDTKIENGKIKFIFSGTINSSQIKIEKFLLYKEYPINDFDYKNDDSNKSITYSLL
jgi:hypothetical protein